MLVMNNAKIPVTVVIPTLNEEHDIEDCLDSVSWAGEILVIDGGSSDSTCALARGKAQVLVTQARAEYGVDRCLENFIRQVLDSLFYRIHSVLLLGANQQLQTAFALNADVLD